MNSTKTINASRSKMIHAVVAFLFVLMAGIVNPALAQGAETTDETSFWLWSFLGRLHPMIVHFPIALLYVALFFQWVAWKRKSDKFVSTIKILTIAGAISSIVAVILGLLLSNTDTYGSDLVPLHQWSGISTMVLASFTAFFYYKNYRRIPFVLLCFTVFGVSVAGYFGGEITHGDDYLSSVLPLDDNEASADPNGFSLASIKGPLTPNQLQDLNLQVRTILAHNCYSCHGEVKAKGDLRLNTRQDIMKGGKDGVVVLAGHPEKSEIIRRLKLSPNDKESMPSKGKKLSSNEIATLEFWIKQGAPWPDGPEKSLFHVAAIEPRLPEIPAATGKLTNPIDLFVNAYFQKNKIKWNAPVDDRIYIRRVYLDVIGLLPPPDSIDIFVKDNTPGKRALLVQKLLNRDHDYVQHWLSFWNDALRNDYSGTGYITGGRMDITKWLYQSLLQNKPYNVFVNELISPDKNSEGFIRGITWRGTINSSQTTEMQAAQNVSQVFLGLNLKCASCHNSFVSDWKLDDSYAFANLFSDSTLEIHRCDKPTGKMADRRILFKQLGEINANAKKKDRLKQLADSLVQPKDGRLYRTLVNRIWDQVMGRGIVEPVDVMDNIPWSQDLLDWMAYDFVASGYNIKQLIFKILTSETYQLPSVSFKEPSMIVDPKFVFDGMLRRRLTAEEFADAVSETLEPVYADSLIETGLLPNDIKMYTPFARAALVKNDVFQTVLGRPNRETVSTSRNLQANLLQALELTNGTLFNETMKKAAIKWKEKYPDPEMMVQEIYRNTLGRFPDKNEISIAENALGKSPPVEAIQDFLWAMALHPEFQLIY